MEEYNAREESAGNEPKNLLEKEHDPDIMF